MQRFPVLNTYRSIYYWLGKLILGIGVLIAVFSAVTGISPSNPFASMTITLIAFVNPRIYQQYNYMMYDFGSSSRNQGIDLATIAGFYLILFGLPLLVSLLISALFTITAEGIGLFLSYESHLRSIRSDQQLIARLTQPSLDWGDFDVPEQQLFSREMLTDIQSTLPYFKEELGLVQGALKRVREALGSVANKKESSTKTNLPPTQPIPTNPVNAANNDGIAVPEPDTMPRPAPEVNFVPPPPVPPIPLAESFLSAIVIDAPNVVFDRPGGSKLGSIPENTKIKLIGRTTDNTLVKVEGRNRTVWLESSVLDISGDLSSLPVARA